MKKLINVFIITIICFCFISCLTVFAESSASIYYQQGLNNIKAKNYSQANNDFKNTIIKGQDKTANYAIKGFKLIIHDKNAPIEQRIIACNSLMQIYDAKNQSNEYFVFALKLIQLISFADENSPLFNKVSKKQMINDFRSEISMSTCSDTLSCAGVNLAKGFCEYALGNKVEGLQSAQKAKNDGVEIAKSKGDYKEIEEINTFFIKALNELDSE